MKRYVALLRGINISGKNKIPMAELKKGFETLAFGEVKTYLNSGNVIFSSDENDIKKLTDQIVKMIKNQFGLDIPVFVLSKEALEDILHNAPDWWGGDSKEIYNNLIFIIPPAEFSDVYNEIGKPKKELERIKNYKEVIFWSFNRKDYQKTNWWPKTVSAKISTNVRRHIVVGANRTVFSPETPTRLCRTGIHRMFFPAWRHAVVVLFEKQSCCF